MATINYKVLAQAAPAATANTDIYTVPASTQAVISTLHVANRSSSATTFRIAVRKAGAALTNAQYIAYDTTVAANDFVAFTMGISLAATDVITVYAATANLSFNVFGMESA